MEVELPVEMSNVRVAVIAVVVSLLSVVVVVLWRCRGGKTSSKSTGTAEARAKQQQKQDKPRFKMATSSSETLLRALDVGMTEDRVLPNIGSRRRKVFFQLLSSENYNTYLMSMAEVPGCHGTNNTSCRDHIIQHFSLLQRLSHRHLQPTLALCLCSKKGEVLAGGVVSGDVRGHPPLLEEGREMPAVTELQVAIIERFHEKGSLKDYMHRVSPTRERKDKYTGSTTALPAAKVAVFGRQILEAVLYLYDNMHSSMLPLGNIRIENIYVEKKGICKVGGYESAFLGYGSWLQQQVKDAGHAPSMDVIMFGHVMYYMCSGGDIKCNGKVVVLPGEEHFEAVDEKCRNILRYIFKMKRTKVKHSLKEISEHMFFVSGACEDQPPSSDSEAEESRLRAGFTKAKDKAKSWLRARASSIPTVKTKSAAIPSPSENNHATPPEEKSAAAAVDVATKSKAD